MLIACTFLLAPELLHAQPTHGDIDVQVRPSPRPKLDQGPGHGNLEYRFAITNYSPKHAHVVTVQYPTDGEFLRTEKTVKLDPRSSAEVVLFQPIRMGGGYGAAKLYIDGQPHDKMISVDSINMHHHFHGGPHGGRMKFIAAQESLVNALANNVYKSGVQREPPPQPVPLPPREPEDKFEFGPEVGIVGDDRIKVFTYRQREHMYERVHSFNNYDDDLRNWSRNWLAYSCLDGVVVKGNALERAPADVRKALFQFTECGGTLLVVGPATLPESWQRTAEKLDKLTRYSPGFGTCLVTDADDIEQWEVEQWWPIADAWYASAAPWSNQHDMYSANNAFQVVESFGIPVRGLFMVMLVFAIAIGPVNMYLLGRTRRRIWLLWTVPLISFLTCVAVFAYMYSAEGWYGHARTEGMTVLDEAGGRASSIGWTAFYSPLTPYDGLHFDLGTELSPQLSDDQHDYRPFRRRDRKRRFIDWTNDQNLRSGWVSARLPIHFKFRRSEPRSERLIVRKEDSTIVNGLKGRIKRLWVADAQGNIATAENIPPGQTARLTKSKTRATGNFEEVRDFYRAADWTRLAAAPTTDVQVSRLRPGCYLAEMEGAPFLPDALAGARKREASIVYGIMKDPIHAH